MMYDLSRCAVFRFVGLAFDLSSKLFLMLILRDKVVLIPVLIKYLYIDEENHFRFVYG